MVAGPVIAHQVFQKMHDTGGLRTGGNAAHLRQVPKLHRMEMLYLVPTKLFILCTAGSIIINTGMCKSLE